jgi:hypothetical protein
VQIYALLGFVAVDDAQVPLSLELTQRRILEALVFEDGIARSAEEVRRRAQLADANTIGQGLSRIRAAWSKSLGPIAKEIFPEARASKGYRLNLPRKHVDVWLIDDLQRKFRDRLVSAQPDEDWDQLTDWLREMEDIWNEAERRNREHPTALIEPASDLGKRVAQLQSRRLEYRKRWAETTIRVGERSELVLPFFNLWLNDPQSQSRIDIALWRLWIEAKADLATTTVEDLDAVIHDAQAVGLDTGVLDAVKRTAISRLTPIEDLNTLATQTSTLTTSTPSAPDGHLLIDLTNAPTRPPIAGLELNVRSRFVGRIREREELARAGVQALRDRTGHLVTITGEPGVGKSRLVAEAVSLINTTMEHDGFEVSWFVGRSVPHAQGIACWALSEIVKSIANVRPQDAPEVAIAKLEARLVSANLSELEANELVRYLAPLVGGESGRAGDTERFYAWGRALGAIAAAEPIALIFEDLHWADEMLLEFLDSLTEQGSPSPLFVVATGRPEFLTRTTSWAGGGRSATTLALTRLDTAQTESLLDDFRTHDDQTLSPKVRTAIVERCGGNPLFAEELARMVDQSGEEETVNGLPQLVEAVVAARLDHLSENAAIVANCAATIGRVFWSGAIERVVALSPIDLRNALAELVRVDLVQRSWSSSFSGQLEYTFWHAIVRDVAASRLPREKIARVHLVTAEWLREVAGNRILDVAEQLAEHYKMICEHANTEEKVGHATTQLLRGQSLDFAIEALRLAGKRAFFLDRTRAIEYLGLALSITPLDHPERPAVLADRVSAYTDLSTIDIGERYAREALLELEGRDAEFSRARILVTLAANISRLGDVRGAIKILEEAVPGLATESHEQHMAAKTLLTFMLASMGEYERAQESIQESWEWCREAMKTGKPTELAMSTTYAFLVDPIEVLDWFETLLVDVSPALRSSAVAAGNIANIQSGVYGPRKALEGIDKALEAFADRPKAAQTWLRGAQVNHLVHVGELSRAHECIELAVDAARALSPMFLMEFAGHELFINLLRFGTVHNVEQLHEVDELLTFMPGTNEMVLVGVRSSAFCHLVLGDKTRVRFAIEGATSLLEKPTDRVSACHAASRLSIFRLALLIGEDDLARRIHETCNPLSKAHEAEVVAMQGYLAAAKADDRKACELLAKAVEMFLSIDMELDGRWIQLHLSRLLQRVGDAAGQALELATLETLETFGAFGIQSGALDGATSGLPYALR